MRLSVTRLICAILSLILLSVPVTAQVYWNYKTAYMAYDRGDFELAADMYKRLAASGHSRAQNDLAFLYEIGQGVPQDLAKAAMWYRKAAEQGHGPAQLRIANFYAAGRGVERDDLEAHKWFSLASVLNTDESRRISAADRRDAVEARLTAAQRVAARDLACSWWRLHMGKRKLPKGALAGCLADQHEATRSGLGRN